MDILNQKMKLKKEHLYVCMVDDRNVKKKTGKPSNRPNRLWITVLHGSIAVIKIGKPCFTIQLRFSVSTHDY